jgi:hypothetical protein
MKTRWCQRCAATSLLVVVCFLCHAAQDGASASQQATDVRRELRSIDYRHYRDLDDYLSRCEQVRGLIPSLKTLYQWSDAELERLRIKYSDNPHLLELADFFVSLNSQDKAGMRVLEQEMGLAAEMSKLPSARRQAFFDERIRPLQQKEDQLSNREIEMAREAKKRGMALPPWLSQSLGDAK